MESSTLHLLAHVIAGYVLFGALGMLALALTPWLRGLAYRLGYQWARGWGTGLGRQGSTGQGGANSG
jgi:hypothetical protein